MYIKTKTNFIYVALFVVSLTAFTYLCRNYNQIVVADVSNNVIRFHVLANSDSTADQTLKLKVRDAVLCYLKDNMEDISSLKEANAFFMNNSNIITTVAQNAVYDNGFDYKVSSDIVSSQFPDKTYGDITLPEGRYNSFTIKIGDAKGHNWWCVLYPPLCFIDASTGILPEDSKAQLSNSITTDEYRYISSEPSKDNASTANEEETSVNFRFKYFTFLNSFFD